MSNVNLNGVKYNLIGLNGNHYFEKNYVASSYIYSIGRLNTHHQDLVIYRGHIGDKSNNSINVTYSKNDRMIIKNGGHCQTLDFYYHNDIPYFLVSVGENNTTSYGNWIHSRNKTPKMAYFAKHIGRIQYHKGTILHLSDIPMLYYLNYGQGHRTLRTDAGLLVIKLIL